jgi:hypothetical protein
MHNMHWSASFGDGVQELQELQNREDIRSSLNKQSVYPGLPPEGPRKHFRGPLGRRPDAKQVLKKAMIIAGLATPQF